MLEPLTDGRCDNESDIQVVFDASTVIYLQYVQRTSRRSTLK